MPLAVEVWAEKMLFDIVRLVSETLSASWELLALLVIIFLFYLLVALTGRDRDTRLLSHYCQVMDCEVSVMTGES